MTTKQSRRFNADIRALGLVPSGDEAHPHGPVTVRGRDFYWVEVGRTVEESLIQADYYDRHFEPRRHHIMEMSSETGHIIHVYGSELVGFKMMPYHTGDVVISPSWRLFLQAIGFRETQLRETPEEAWLYWIPAGDEMMVGYPHDKGYFEFDGDWLAWAKLRELNPGVFNDPKVSLGSSEEEGSNVLLFRKRNSDWDPPIVYLAEKKLIDLYYLR